MPPGTQLACAATDECPAGQSCVEGRCLGADQLDVPPIAFVADPIVEPPLVSDRVGFSEFVVTFELNVDVDATVDGAIGATLDETQLSCARESEARYACDGNIAADEAPPGCELVLVRNVGEALDQLMDW